MQPVFVWYYHHSTVAIYRACILLFTHIGLTGAGPIAGVVIAGVVLLVILLLLVLFGLLVYTRKKSPERTCKIFEVYIFHICMAKVHGVMLVELSTIIPVILSVLV